MNQRQNSEGSIYSPQLIEFASVGVEFAGLVERAEDLRALLQGCLRTLPRLYSLMLTLPAYLYDAETDYIEEYISEHSYDRVRLRLSDLLGEYDTYLTTLADGVEYTETAVLAFISEQLADVYQHIGNLLGILREENEQALPLAIGRCHLYWREHWGASVCSVLGALHQAYLSLPEEDLEEDEADEADEY